MANIGKVLSDIFFGTEQSKYAALAIFITIAILCFFVLFTASDISVEQRIVIVFFILLTAVPSILFSLFELTCIVTGGNPNTRWWCYWFAWFITIVIVIYCLFIIISMFLSMASYDTAMATIAEKEEENKITASEANAYAKGIMMQNDTEKIRESRPMPPQPPSMPPQSPVMAPQSPQMPPQSPQMPQQIEQPPMMVERSMPVQYMNNSLDSMGYDSSDMYASISNFANAPRQSSSSNIAREQNMQTAQSTPPVTIAGKGAPPPAISAFTNEPEPFSLGGDMQSLASSVSSSFGI